MHIESLKIKNYKSCLETDLSLNKRLTALVGINGSGKTNILKAIASLTAAIEYKGFSYERTESREESRIDTKLEGVLRDGEKTVSFKFDCIQPLGNRTSDELIIAKQYWDFSEYEPDAVFDDLPLIILFSLIKEGTHPEVRHGIYPSVLLRAKYLGRNIFTSKKIKTIKKLPMTKIHSLFSDLRYYSASQFMDPGRCPTSIETEDGMETRRGLANSNHKSFIHGLYKQYREKSKKYDKFRYLIGPECLNLVSDIEFKSFDIPSNKYEVISAGKYKIIESKRELIIPEIRIEEKLLSPNQLSEGTFKTMSLLYYLLTDSNGLAIIEEPEVSVHRGLLLSLLDVIKTESIDRQIIISTHSESVIDKMDPDWVRLIKRIPKKGTKAEKIDETMTRSKYKLLKEYLSETGNLGEYFKEEGI